MKRANLLADEIAWSHEAEIPGRYARDEGHATQVRAAGRTLSARDVHKADDGLRASSLMVEMHFNR